MIKVDNYFWGLYDRRIPINGRGKKVYKVFIGPAILYLAEFWAVKKIYLENECSITVMLRWMSGNTLRDKLKYMCICKKLEAAPIKDKMKE